MAAVPKELLRGGSLSGTMGMSLRSGGKMKNLTWDSKTVKAVVENSKGVHLKLNLPYTSLMVNGVDKINKMKVDETNDRYYLIDTDDVVEMSFTLQ